MVLDWKFLCSYMCDYACIVTVIHREADKIGDQSFVAGGFQKHCSSSELSILSDSCLQFYTHSRSKRIEILLADDTVGPVVCMCSIGAFAAL